MRFVKLCLRVNGRPKPMRFQKDPYTVYCKQLLNPAAPIDQRLALIKMSVVNWVEEAVMKELSMDSRMLSALSHSPMCYEFIYKFFNTLSLKVSPNHLALFGNL